MTTAKGDISTPKVRLKFIDMARSIAILLMLEGHFVDDSMLMEIRDPNNAVYSTWLFIRSFTSAIFLTVTGLIFVYLMLKNRSQGWIENIRIRKGIKRFVELIFWGFLLQWYAFHVLECIAFGILAIILVYGLYKLIRFVPLWIYFFAAGMLIFGSWPLVKDHEVLRSVENGLINFCQWIYGTERTNVMLFPIIPFTGFTMFGAMIGALLHDFHRHVKTNYFPAIFAVTGALLYFYGKAGLSSVDKLFESGYYFTSMDWLFERLGMVLMVLSILMYIDKYFGDRLKQDNLFLKVGQNTLTIYITHMMILFGSVIGIGINDFYHKKLGGWEVAFGATLFVLFFVLLIKYLDWIKARLSFILEPIRKFFNKIFFVS